MSIVQLFAVDEKVKQQPTTQVKAAEETAQQVIRIQAKIVELFCLTVQSMFVDDNDDNQEPPHREVG